MSADRMRRATNWVTSTAAVSRHGSTGGAFSTASARSSSWSCAMRSSSCMANMNPRTVEQKKEFEAVKSWMSTGDVGVLSHLQLCDTFGLDPVALRMLSRIWIAP